MSQLSKKERRALAFEERLQQQVRAEMKVRDPKRAQRNVTQHEAYLGTVAVRDRFDRKVNRDYVESKKSLEIGAPARKANRRKGAVGSRLKSTLTPRGIAPRMTEYANCVGRPMESKAAKGIANGNVIPTNNSFVFTTVSTNEFTVNLGTTTQVGLFPGHTSELTQSVGGSMDPQSFHSFSQLIGVGGVGVADYIIGPFKGTTVARQAIGFIQTGLGFGASSVSTGVATATPIANDVTLPFTSLEGDSNHTRWRLIGMGVKILNITPEATKDGDIKYCQPPMSFSNTAIGEFTRFAPQFQMTREAENDEGLTIVWIPRQLDLGYWHTEVVSSSATSNPQDAGINIWCHAHAADNNYTMEVVCHWEASGVNLQTLSSTTVSGVHDTAVTETGIRATRAVSATGHGLGKMITHFASKAVGAIAAAAPPPRILVSQGVKALSSLITT